MRKEIEMNKNIFGENQKILGIGDKYQQETKYIRDRMHNGWLDWDAKPPTFKQYPDALKKIPLPEPSLSRSNELWEVLKKRRSVRDYSLKPISIEELVQLIWATQGITAIYGRHYLRTAPSAGALYPIETYLIVNRVVPLSPGIYHLYLPHWSLEMLEKGDYSYEISRAALGQEMAKLASVVFIWTAVVERAKWKYNQRAYRYIYLDAGHIAQNLYLAATNLGLGCCTIGAFFDDEVNQLLKVDGTEETAIYLACIGAIEQVENQPQPLPKTAK